MSELIVNLTDADFKETIIKSEIPVLVDFWAPWCGPCRALAPTLEKLAEEYQGKLKIVKINIDDNQVQANEYSVRSVPTLLLFKKGEKVDTKVGNLSLVELKEFVNTYLSD